MTNICIPPSPNWYSPHVSDGTGNGLFCFAAKNSVVIVDASQGTPSYKDNFCVSQGRVISVSFCRSEILNGETPNLLTVSDDKSLRVWNVSTKTIVRETVCHTAVVDADWRGNLSTSVIFSGEKGSLLVWDFAHNVVSPVQTCSPQSLLILRSHPQNPDIAALGYKGGLIVVQGLKKGNNAIYKLKGHTEDVLSMSWSLPSGSSELQLASTALDRTLRIWDVEIEKARHTLKIPASSKNRKVDVSQKGRQWVVATWVPSSPGVVACSTMAGDVCLCDTHSPRSGWDFLEVESDSAGHFRCVFSLTIVGAQQKTYVVSTSLDRNIVFWDVAAKKSAYCIPSFGGFPYSLSFSPIACASLAIGGGDSTIKLWRTDCVTNPYSSASFWQGIRGRVMTVAWHPKKEDVIAFGTDDGKVGTVNVNTKQAVVSVSHHKQVTYVVCWAELPDLDSDDKAEKAFLLSCGDGKVKVHHLPKLEKEALDLSTSVLKETSTKLKWTAVNFDRDLCLLTLGSMDGSVHIYSSKTLRKIAILEAQRKAVENVLWHPTHTASSLQESSLKFFLACSSCEGPIHLYDLRGLAGKKDEVLHVTQSTTQLIGHSSKVVSLSWSPFREGCLASASYDGTVQVWDAVQNRPVANFRGHSGRAISCCWSPVDPDVVYSGGEDCTVRRWLVSQQKDTLAPSKTEKQKLKAEAAPKPIVLASDTLCDSETDGAEKALDSKSSSSEGRDSLVQLPGKSSSAKSGPPSGSKKKKPMKSFFPAFSAQENKPKEFAAEDCMSLADKLADKSCARGHFTEPNSHLNMFLDTEGVLATVCTEISQHKKDLNFDQAFQMMIWKGDVAEALHEAAAARKLNDTLVSLAPSVSRTLWLEMCEKYAEQLLSDGEHHRAALYLLTCHKIPEAIQLLCSNGHVREALVIAKAHLVEGDPETADIYVAWAEKAKRVGNYEQAARCYLAADDARNAVKVLQNRRDARTKRAAAYIAKKFGLQAEANAVFADAIEAALEQKDWDTAQKLVEEQEKPKVFLCLVGMHRCLTEALACIKAASKFSTEGSGEDRQANEAILRGGHADVSAKFLQNVRETWNSCNVPFFKASEQSADLRHLLKVSCNSVTEQEALFRSSVCLTLAVLESETYDLNVAKAVSCSLLFSTDFFNQLCSLLYCTKVSGEDTAFSGDVAVILDCLKENEVSVDFQCPASTVSLLDEFLKLKGRNAAQVNIGRDILGLLFSVAVIEVLEKIPLGSSSVSDILKRLEPLILSPSLACLEHLMKKLRRKQELLMHRRVELMRMSLQSSGDVAHDVEDRLAEDVDTLSLQRDCEILKNELQEATLDCNFPDVSALIDTILVMLKCCDDKEIVRFKNTLTSWKELILSENPGSGDA
ncbi:gem-associated protein 5-like [Ornithodoros turicata]|uniref:gem-associated protein 5-like n=1 Tax=Ornithodoros turicata TaxID=34597 RepID=UPI003139F8DF